MMAGLTSVGVHAVHFIDGNHASFFFPPPPRNEINGGAGAGGLRGGSGRVAARPKAGQIGVLRLDDVGHRSQFVVTTEQPLPDKLTVSAHASLAWPRAASDSGGAVRVGGAGGVGGEARECVKYAGDVGTWGQKRTKWFPEEEDPRELLRALDNFCPISWLRKDQQKLHADTRDQDNGDPMLPSPANSGGYGNAWAGRKVARGLFATVVGGPGAVGKKKKVNIQSRRLVIYQRDRNRKLLNTEEVSDTRLSLLTRCVFIFFLGICDQLPPLAWGVVLYILSLKSTGGLPPQLEVATGSHRNDRRPFCLVLMRRGVRIPNSWGRKSRRHERSLSYSNKLPHFTLLCFSLPLISAHILSLALCVCSEGQNQMADIAPCPRSDRWWTHQAGYLGPPRAAGKPRFQLILWDKKTIVKRQRLPCPIATAHPDSLSCPTVRTVNNQSVGFPASG